MVRGAASFSTRRKWQNSSNKADKRIGCLRVSATRLGAVSGATSQRSTGSADRDAAEAGVISGGPPCESALRQSGVRADWAAPSEAEGPGISVIPSMYATVSPLSEVVIFQNVVAMV